MKHAAFHTGDPTRGPAQSRERLSSTALRALCAACVLLAFAAPASAQCQLDELVAFDGGASDDLGTGVAIDGDVAIVGAPDDDDVASNAGAAYVYRFDGTSWVQEQKLTASDGASNDHFGQVVGVSGAVAVVGSPDDDDAGSRSGSAYVFRFDGTSWSEEQKLVASDAAASDRFGFSVGASGDVIAVGAKFDDDVMSDSGSAYVFRFQGGLWGEEQKLTASDPAVIAQFGDAIAIRGTLIVVGAWQDDDDGTFSGAAYVYRFNGASWSEEQKLKAADAAAFRWMGRSVAVSGDLIAVGAYGDGTNGSEAGAVYVFRFGGVSWSQEQKLLASDGAANDRLGWAVGVDGELLSAGAYAGGAGSAYLFEHDGTAWSEVAKLVAGDGAVGDELGYALAQQGGLVLAGARSHDAPGGTDSGAAYVIGFGAGCFGRSFCDGADGSLASCPCLNAGTPTSGCDIAQATGGVELSIVDQDPSLPQATLQGNGFPAMAAPTAIVIRSPDLDPLRPVVFGDGLRCVGTSSLVRLAATTALGGVSQHVFGHGVMAGTGTFYYQLWFRNTPSTFCDAFAAFNLSNGVTLLWP